MNQQHLANDGPNIAFPRNNMNGDANDANQCAMPIIMITLDTH